MKTATLDLLDSSLNAGYLKKRALAQEDRFQIYRHEVLCDPQDWEKYLPLCQKHNLNWSEYKYSEQRDLDSEIKSNDPGIYIFYIRPEQQIHFFPRYPLYVGISNEGNSGRPLRQRLKDYHNIKTILKRENVHRMLELYYKEVWVAYSLLHAVSSKAMEELEVNLHGFLYPRFSRRDFPVSLKRSQKAFGKI